MRLPHLPGFALALGACLASHALAPWTPRAGPGGGFVNRLAMDGSRICAATLLGIYCTERDREDWRPAFLEGREVVDLAKTRSGWVAVLTEPGPDVQPGWDRAVYGSQDGGAHWTRMERSPMLGPFTSLMQAYGDSLVSLGGEDSERHILLSDDGGSTWKPILPPVGGLLEHCVPSAQSILCAEEQRIVRRTSQAPEAGWVPLGSCISIRHVYSAPGRLYAVDTLGVLSEYGPSGLERQLPALPGFEVFFASDSLILAKSADEYAYARGRTATWTRVAIPYQDAPLWSSNCGVWTGSEAVLPSPIPHRVSLEGGVLAFTPFNRGLHSAFVWDIASSGGRLLARTQHEIWHRSPAGNWSPYYRSPLGIGRFWHAGAEAVVTPSAYTAPSQFTVDSGKTWRAQPATLPGRIQGIARVGDRYLALVARLAHASGGDPADDGYSLYEAGDLTGAWTSRAEYGMRTTNGLLACGPRLYTVREEGMIHSSLDTGRTWSAAQPRPHIDWQGGIFPPDIPRLYSWDSVQRLVESSDCGESWSHVQVPWTAEDSLGRFAYTFTRLPLIVVTNPAESESRVHTLPGAPPEWAGIEAHVLPGTVRTLHLHEGILYASVPGKGIYALDPSPAGIGGRPKVPRARAPATLRSGGWRRIDGRALPPGTFPAQAPVFRPGAAR